MSEIEKMYENAGVKKFNPKEKFSLDDCEEYCLDNDCKKCSWRKYPPFTAEKQLELIKLLLQKIDWIDDLEMTYRPIREDWIMSIETVTEFADENPYLYRTSSRTFEEGLARLVNNLWQDLTEDEKQQVKEILE